MGVLVTTAGGAHFTELTAGTPPTTTFDTLLFDRGNVVPAVTDTTAVLTNQVAIPVLTELPVLDDQDPRNTGRGATTWTWAFRVTGGSTPVVASNVALAASGPSVDLCIHADEVEWTQPYQDLLVWLNLASTTEATLVTAFEDNPVEATNLRAAGPQDVVFAGPGSQILGPGKVMSQVWAGEAAPIRGYLTDAEQQPIVDGDVRKVTQAVSAYDAAMNKWVPYRRKALDVATVCSVHLQPSALFPYRSGFNFSAELPGRDTRDGRGRQVTYELELIDGSRRVIQHVVRVAAH